MSFFPVLYFLMMLAITACNLEFHSVSSAIIMAKGENYEQSTSTITQKAVTARHRKLMNYSGRCRNKDISISQSRDLSAGIPQFIVEVVNTCVCGCDPSEIHLHCGWFASARIVNPRMFKRVGFDDCLVNEGKPLKSSQIIRFTYSNSFMYPLVFKSAKLC